MAFIGKMFPEIPNPVREIGVRARDEAVEEFNQKEMIWAIDGILAEDSHDMSDIHQ